MSYSDLPRLNALLNGISAILLTMAFVFIRRKNVPAHKRCMLSAIACSVLFLISYLTYHYHAGATHFANPPWFRPFYIALLISHTFLAVTIIPLIVITLTFALRSRFDRHRKIARWTWPIWMYVSVTGVLIYYLLYVKFPQARPARNAQVEMPSQGWVSPGGGTRP